MSKKIAKAGYICSFCGKNQNEIEVLVTGSDATICNECIEVCNKIVGDYCKRRKIIEVLEKLTEPQLVRILMADIGVFRWTLDFMLRGAFEHKVPVFLPPRPDFDSLLIGLEISRDELHLHADQAPGDIDMLIIPQHRGENLYGKTMVIEIKVVRPTIRKPSRNANSLGETQSNKLVTGGFPYVGLLHLIISEPSPEHMRTELLVESVNVPKGMPVPPPTKRKFDLFPLRATERQLGRLKKLRLPDYVGFNPVDLDIRFKEKNGQSRLGIAGYGIQQDREVKRNPNSSQETLKLIEDHYGKNHHRYLTVKWFS